MLKAGEKQTRYRGTKDKRTRKGIPNKVQRKGIEKLGEKKAVARYKNAIVCGDKEGINAEDILNTIKVIRKRKGKLIDYEYKEDLELAIQAYWDYVEIRIKNGEDILPDLEDAGTFLGVSRTRLIEWEKRNYHDFGDLISQLRNDIATPKKQRAYRGQIPPVVFATDMNNNHDYTQKQESVVHTYRDRVVDAVSVEELRAKYLTSALPTFTAEVVDGKAIEVKS